MGIRETLNKNPAITTAATIGLIVIALVVIVYQMWPSGRVEAAVRQVYYTDDDGATYFAEDSDKVPPFKSKNGKEAVRAHVYTLSGGAPKVEWMEKFNTAAKEKIDQLVASGKRAEAANEYLNDNNKQVKKPGAASKWSPASFETISRLKRIERDGVYAIEVMPQPAQ